MHSKRIVKCPICKQEYELSVPPPPEFPFCSQRCKLVDLGRWLNEDYFISRPLNEGEQEELEQYDA